MTYIMAARTLQRSPVDPDGLLEVIAGYTRATTQYLSNPGLDPHRAAIFWLARETLRLALLALVLGLWVPVICYLWWAERLMVRAGWHRSNW